MTGKGNDELPPPYAPPVAYPVAPAPTTVYVVGRNNRTYILPPDTYVVDVASGVPATFGNSGVVCRCPNCRCIVETYVERTGSCGPWVWLWTLLFLIIFWPLFWVPLVCGFGGGEFVHYCPVCDTALAVVR